MNNPPEDKPKRRRPGASAKSAFGGRQRMKVAGSTMRQLRKPLLCIPSKPILPATVYVFTAAPKSPATPKQLKRLEWIAMRFVRYQALDETAARFLTSEFAGTCLGLSARGIDGLKTELQDIRKTFGESDVSLWGWLAWMVLAEMHQGKIALIENTPKNELTRFIFYSVSRFDPEGYRHRLPEEYTNAFRYLVAFRYDFEQWRKR